MKHLVPLFLALLLATACSRTEDDTGATCTNDCTTISGKFISADHTPVPNVRVQFYYRIPGGELGGGYIRKIVNTLSDKDGNYSVDFHLKDDELWPKASGYFMVTIDDSKLDVTKYIRTDNLIGYTTANIDYPIMRISSRDTVINNTFYIPKKAYIKVHLNNFVPQQDGDRFEVQTLYPFGQQGEYNSFLDTYFSTGFSGYDNFKATEVNTTLQVFVAENEKNVIRILKRKNGVYTNEEYTLQVPYNNTIELTYDY